MPLRNVAITAMELATLERLFPGRVMPGVGHDVRDWMGQVGARAESPMTLLREYATALRALLHGEQVTTSGRYVRLDGVALDWPPSPPPPLLVGAMAWSFVTYLILTGLDRLWRIGFLAAAGLGAVAGMLTSLFVRSRLAAMSRRWPRPGSPGPGPRICGSSCREWTEPHPAAGPSRCSRRCPRRQSDIPPRRKSSPLVSRPAGFVRRQGIATPALGDPT